MTSSCLDMLCTSGANKLNDLLKQANANVLDAGQVEPHCLQLVQPVPGAQQENDSTLAKTSKDVAQSAERNILAGLGQCAVILLLKPGFGLPEEQKLLLTCT